MADHSGHVCLSLGVILLMSLFFPTELRPQRDKLFSMNNEQLYELKMKSQKFNSLPQSEQDRLRELHRQLHEHPDAAELKRVLSDYNQWLNRLNDRVRLDLAELPLDKKLEQIRQIRQQQALDELGFLGETRLTRDDLSQLSDWIDPFLERNKQKILAVFGNGGGFEVNERALRFMFTRMDDEQRKGLFTPTEVDSLAQQLSDSGKEILARAASEDNHATFVRNCIIAMWQSEHSDEELQNFFEESLSLKQQAKLDSMNPNDRYEVLRRARSFFELNNIPVPEEWDPESFLPGRRFDRGSRGPRPSLDDEKRPPSRPRPPGKGDPKKPTESQ
jgi:hypothetical protein